MTDEEKHLLLKDLCARLPYGVICKTEKGNGHLCSINQTFFGIEYGVNISSLKRDYFDDIDTDEQVVKPYLRPMSSMTEEEKKECLKITFVEATDWLNVHHFDYHGLISMGLALEAPEGMYKIERKAYIAGTKKQKVIDIDKACSIFCYTGCPNKINSYNCLDNKCDTWKIFRKAMEE